MILMNLFNCNKIEKMKNKINPASSYKEAEIDKFYWIDSESDYEILPLVKPFQLIRLQGNNEWNLVTGFNKFDEISIFNVVNFNIHNMYIYGSYYESTGDKKYFIVNYKYLTDETKKKFEKDSDYMAELQKLNLPEKFLNPDEMYEEFQQNPILDWFPEDIKKQLNEVKAKLKR